MRKKKNKNIDWTLLAKYLSGETSAEENAAVHGWETQDGENRQLIRTLREKWEKIPFISEEKFDTDQAWKNVSHTVTATPVITPMRENGSLFRKPAPSLAYFARIAAIIVLMMGSSYLIVSRYSAITSFLTGKMIVASDPAAEKSIVLPDGSQVHLNASSKIVYSENKKEHTRKVRLTGEAFFDVRHDEENPFIVSANNAIIRVMGTSFNIIAEEGDGPVSVFVESGSVELSSTGSYLSPVIIEAGFSGLVTATKIERISTTDPNLLSWKTRNLVFHEATMTEVIEALNHTFHTNIICREEQIMDFRFTGNFNDQPVDTVLQVLCTAFHLQFESGDESIELRLED